MADVSGSDEEFDKEVERRLQLLETPGTGESYLPDLPVMDVAVVVAVLTIISIVLVVWAY